MTGMKLYTPEKTELIDVSAVRPHGDGLLIEGKIMGAMPMKAVLQPRELRAGLRFLRLKLIWTLLRMIFRSGE
jgi:hypothetical protein